MSEIEEIIELYKNKFKIFLESINGLNAKIIRNSERVESLNDEVNECKFVKFIAKYTKFFAETFAKFEKEFELPFYDLCLELFPDTIKNQQNKSNLIQNNVSIDSSIVLSDQMNLEEFKFLSLNSSEYKMTVSHVKSPALFFLNLETSDLFLKQLGIKLNEKYFSSEANEAFEPDVNSIVAAQYSNDFYWYRAKIIEIDKKKRTAFVFYVDFGNTETISFSKLRQLEPQHLIQLGQAVPFSLINASPFKANEWTHSAISRFEELLSSSLLIVKVIFNKDWPINFCSIRLKSEANIVDSDVLEILINENHAIHENSMSKQMSTFLPMINTEKYFPKLETTQYSEEDTVLSSIEINVEKTIPNHFISLGDEQMFECEVVLVKNPSEFFIRPLEQSSLDYLMLQEEMLNHYQSNSSSNINYNNDKILAVRYNSSFHRAYTLSTGKNEHHMVVYFIDLGINHEVPITDIYRLESQFFKLPAKVISCSLLDVVPTSNDKKWSNESIKWFYSEIKNHKRFLVSTYNDVDILEISFDKSLEVILSVMRDDLLYTLNNEIVRLGFAKTSNQIDDCLNINALNTKYLADEAFIRKKRVEEYVEHCIGRNHKANNLENNRIKDKNESILSSTNSGKATHRNFFNHDCATPLINSLKEYSEPNGHEMIEAKADQNALARVKKELNDLKNDPFIKAIPTSDKLLEWKATLIGPVNSPYEGGIFKLKIDIPNGYPFEPPKILFETPIYHPNINDNGEISMDILKSKWNPTLTVSKISIQLFLYDPDADSCTPLMQDIASLYRLDKEQYERNAKEWTKKYAIA